MHKCECGKAYLSQLALSNHRKSKHENSDLKEIDNFDNLNSEISNSNFSKKRRGRPKKNNNIANNNFEDAEYHYKLYFKKDYRKKRDNENYSISDFIELVFQDIYISNRSKCLLKINLPNEHPLLNLILNKENPIFSKNSQETIKREIVMNKILSNQDETEKFKGENLKDQYKNKSNILNFSIEKKYRNNLKNKNNSKNEVNKKTEQQEKNCDLISNLKEGIEFPLVQVKHECLYKDLNSIQNADDIQLNLIEKPIKEKSNFKKLALNKNTGKKIEETEKNYLSNQSSIINNNLNSSFSESSDDFQSKSDNNNTNSNKKNICCDEIFYDYLKSIIKYANQKYFVFVFKFIIIFRECINTYKNIELENSILVLKENIPLNIKEFTQYYDAEQAPELCNEFISEYLQSCDYFGFEKSEIPEIIDIIQHFCYWMYENNYTSSRLSLLNMN